jgi:hypothetical protein
MNNKSKENSGQDISRNNSFSDPVYKGNPYNPMTFTIIPNSIVTFNGMPLNENNQIGIFDGNNLVGVHTGLISKVVQIICNAQETIGDKGFIAGNPITFKLYDSINDIVIEGKNLEIDVNILTFRLQGSGLITRLVGESKELIKGCIDSEACNFNSEATDDDGSCWYLGLSNDYCDCDGNVLDECNICGGSGIPEEECDCDGNVLDECDVCGGDGLSCKGCSDPDASNYSSTANIDDGSCTYSKLLNTGWNIMGTLKSPTIIINPPNELDETVYKYNSDGYESSSVNDILEPLTGYWVRVSEEITITLSVV